MNPMSGQTKGRRAFVLLPRTAKLSPDSGRVLVGLLMLEVRVCLAV